MNTDKQDESTQSPSMNGNEDIREAPDQEWRDLYMDVINSDLTIECTHCGYTLYGDEPRAMVICYKCWQEGVRTEE